MSADATVTIETIVPAVAAGSGKSGAAGVRGKPVSGRVWKTTQTKRHTSMKPRMLRQGWQKQIEERKQHQVMKAIEKELKDEKAAERQERLKRKEENEKKAEVVQKVSAAKVKRMKKKQLRQLRKE
ncbi:uncharacterized protein EV422DRAFT_337156 [Fimicolochytrium jonesii]|uniref:uncharacterized protein n=1 Tax=Fimicolochytrium jonesii TaxID=1396493 RepID=UPI0022FEF165|nr:uncharacterized protein EV422DRAFT_337156 [Fimicolochytrium jonesii]KAI8815960.1 hypothetical protein EV422DRAFT_337156 [Fimicolochytrium jonesii]